MKMTVITGRGGKIIGTARRLRTKAARPRGAAVLSRVQVKRYT